MINHERIDESTNEKAITHYDLKDPQSLYIYKELIYLSSKNVKNSLKSFRIKKAESITTQQ